MQTPSEKRVEVILDKDQSFVWVDLNMVQTASGTWTTEPRAKLRDDVKAWTIENNVQITVHYPFDGKTLMFRTVDDALLFKLRWV